MVVVDQLLLNCAFSFAGDVNISVITSEYFYKYSSHEYST